MVEGYEADGGEHGGRYEELAADFKKLMEKLKVDEDGRITMDGARYIFLPQDLLVNRIFVSFLRVIGPTLNTIVWPVIGFAGYVVARQLMSEGTPPEKIIEAYAKFNNPRGWGLTEAVSFDMDKPEAIVRMRNSMFARGVRESVENVKESYPFYTCPWGHVFQGAIRAALEESGRQPPPLTYTETKCEALGDDCCEWHIKRKEEE